MVDRLKDLKLSPNSNMRDNHIDNNDDSNETDESDQNDKILELLGECTKVSNDINKINEKIDLITIDIKHKQFNERATEITNDIKNIKNRIDALSSLPFTGSEKRIQTNNTATLYKKLHDTYNTFVKKTETIEKSNKKFHDSVVESNKTDLENGEKVGNVLMYQTDEQMAEETLGYIQNRHKDILKLAQSIEELKQLFVDMAFLVAQQGELLDSVEANVNTAEKDIEKGAEDIEVAVKYQKKSRKKLYILLAIVIIILIAVLSPVLATYL